MSNNSSNEDSPSGIDSPPTGEEGEKIEQPSTGEPPKDNEEPESLTRAEAFLLVVSICVSEDPSGRFCNEKLTLFYDRFQHSLQLLNRYVCRLQVANEHVQC